MYKGAFMIAAPSSNSGKTTLTLGLIKALMNKGLKVQPFKCGPDYIDPMHHRQVAGCDSYNLDTWMSSPNHVKEIYNRHSSQADISIVEGVMGLFDGAIKDNGSPAQLALLLDIPVIMVVNASSMAYSAAPLLYGFKHFNPGIKLAGVIFNKVASENHYSFLKDAAIDAGVTPLGYLQRNNNLSIESRHLGLSMPHEHEMNIMVDEMAEMITHSIDLNALLASAATIVQPSAKPEERSRTLKISIARDEAFNFMYPANIDALATMGEITFFSPLHDTHLPVADLVWLPGGYPELYAQQLSANREMMEEITLHINQNKALIAECGGFIYLGKQLITEDHSYPMTGIFNHTTTLSDMKLTLGYRQTTIGKSSFRGHEFHYSKLTDTDSNNIAQSTNAKGQMVDMPVTRHNNCLASYMHFYCGEVEKMKELVDLLI